MVGEVLKTITLMVAISLWSFLVAAFYAVKASTSWSNFHWLVGFVIIMAAALLVLVQGQPLQAGIVALIALYPLYQYANTK